MAGVADMLAWARKSLGLGEPNYIQSWYRERNGSAYSGNFAWCDAAVTYWAYKSGNHKAVCPKGDRAYTVYHAQDFQKLGRWYSGTTANLKKSKPGDIVFFDWGGSNSIGAIDHVGVIEKNLGDGRVQTIEGNTSNKCLRKVRDASTIAGYGRPAYSGSGGGDAPAEDKPVEQYKAPSANLSKGSTGAQVKGLQSALNLLGASPKLVVDGDFGPATEKALKAFQKKAKIGVDGIYGPESRKALQKALDAKKPAPKPTPTPTPTPSPEKPAETLKAPVIANAEGTIGKGYSGPEVTMLQKCLNKVLGGKDIPVTGKYDDATVAAVKTFQDLQASKGLFPLPGRGDYGPATSKLLDEYVSGKRK